MQSFIRAGHLMDKETWKNHLTVPDVRFTDDKGELQ